MGVSITTESGYVKSPVAALHMRQTAGADGLTGPQTGQLDGHTDAGLELRKDSGPGCLFFISEETALHIAGTNLRA